MHRFTVFAVVAVTISSSAAAGQSTECPAAARKFAAPPLSLFEYDRSAALAVRDSLVGTDGGVDVHAVSFASPKGGRATGLLHLPHDSLRISRGKLPAIVVMHGAPGHAAGMRGLSMPIARQGAIVFALDAPFARRDPNNPLSFTERDSVDQVQLMVDLLRAVDYLLTRNDVDASKLGYVGVSYGAAMGAMFAGLERRIAAYALLVGDAGLAAHFTKPDGGRMPPLPHVSQAQWCRWFAAMEPLSSARFIGRAAPARVLFLWGREDRTVPPYLAEQLYSAAGKTKEARWYDAGHMLPPAAHHDMIDWLASQIDIAPVSAAERARFAPGAP